MTSRKVLNLLFAVLLISSPLHILAEHHCNHDNLVYDAEYIDVDEDFNPSEGRNLQSTTYPGIRMIANYDNLASAGSAFQSYFQNELIPPILSWFNGAIQVRYPINGLLKVSSSQTCDVSTPAELRAGVNADYYIIFNSENLDTSVVASSRACQQASGSQRPITAYSMINRHQLSVSNGDVLLHEKNMYLVIHEMFHTLAISKNLFSSYIDDSGKTLKNHVQTATVGGETQTVINIPALTAKLQAYYGCSSVPGLIMENDGGSGTATSHLERKFFEYETISSGDIYGRRVSQFSLGLLEGSGWYTANYSYAEPFFLGQGEGCGFLNNKCSSNSAIFPDFCSGSNRGCTTTGRAGGSCNSDSNANGCKFISNNVDYDCMNPDGIDNARLSTVEAYGRAENSKCFTGSLSTRKSSSSSGSATSFCFKYNCVGSGVDTVLQVQLGATQITCTAAGAINVDGYYGTFNCPEPVKFCSTIGVKYCPRNCMNRGNCVNNQCVCNPGFTGIDCGLYV